MKNLTVIVFVVGWLAFLTPARAEEPLRRGLFVSLIQNPPVLSSRAQILELIRFAKSAHIDTLFIQVYRANQAWFPSQLADSQAYQMAVKNVGEDPFALLIKEAHQSGISVHAWLNLLSLSTNTRAPILKKYGPDVLTRNLKDKRALADYKIDNQYFLEPGDSRVRQELKGIVTELLRAYPGLDGIQFDYIRYPDKNPFYGYTSQNIKRFKDATGLTRIEDTSKVWQDWKRSQVTDLLKMLIQKARVLRPDIVVSATGCAPYIRAYAEAFQDWPSWIDEGIVDFVTVMSYADDPAQFEKEVSEAKKKAIDFKKVNIGVGAYKLVGKASTFAQEFQMCQASQSRACVVFHYGNLLEDPRLVQALKAPQDFLGRAAAGAGRP